MLYPLNVHKQIRDAGKATGTDVSKFFGLLFLMVSVALYFGIDFALKLLIGTGGFISFIITAVIMFFVGYYAFRFFIFKEDEKMREYSGQSKDTFTRYVDVRRNSDLTTNVYGKEVACFEYTDGSAFCLIQLKFGGNDTAKAKNTFNTFKKIVHILGEHGLEFRTFDMSENFFRAQEYLQYVNTLNRIQNKELAYTLVHITEHMLDVCEKTGNTSTVYLEIISQNTYKFADFEHAVSQISNLLNKGKTAFREISFLTMKEMLLFLEDFYGMEMIDLSTMKVLEFSGEDAFSSTDVAEVYEIVLSNGRVFKLTGSNSEKFSPKPNITEVHK